LGFGFWVLGLGFRVCDLIVDFIVPVFGFWALGFEI
jgi:hypothetical protein